MGCDIHTVVQKKYGDAWQDLTEQPCFDRNYTVFTALAGVRRQDELLPTIVSPRGLPSDFDDFEDVANNPDCHTHSWLLLPEILSYDWQQPLHAEGCVDAQNFQAWEVYGRPQRWSGGTWGRNIVYCSHDEMRRRLTQPRPEEKGQRPYTTVRWTVPVGDYCQSFLETIASLKAMGNPERIRIVFWFDN